MIWHKLLERTPSTIRRMLSGAPHTLGDASSLELTELEDRILMSATPMAPDALADADVDEPVEVDDTSASSLEVPPSSELADAYGVSDALLPDPATTPASLEDVDLAAGDRHELAFIDTSVDGYEELLTHLVDQQDAADNLQVVLLNDKEDGIEQITRALEEYDQLDAVHFLSHGTHGSIKLGNTWLDADRLNAYAGMIAGWSDALSSDADMLLYSCDLAASPDGLALLDGLHALTGADVAASVDATGHTSLGGDWELEYHLGSVESAELLSPAARAQWFHIMSSTYVRDDFDSLDFTGNSGPVHWTGNWDEIGESNGANFGNVQVVTADLGSGSTHCLYLNSAWGYGLSRELDLSTATSATLSFTYERHDSGGSTVYVQASSDGGWNWDTLGYINGGTDSHGATVSLDLSSHMATHTQVRFVTVGFGSGHVYLDAVQVEYEISSGLPYLPGNNAPVLNSGDALTLSSIFEDQLDNAGTTVASILASASDDRITDADASALEGIAVIGADNTHGQWQYDANADGNWLAFGAVNDHSAVLLGSRSLVRFVPTADFTGSAGQIQFRAWDHTIGCLGDNGCDVSTNGNEYPFSTATDTAGITVLAVNDAPQLTVPAGLSVDEDTELAVSGICVADIDSGAADLQVTLAVGHGQLTLSTTSGLTFTTGDGAADPALVFTGSLTDINAALATLKYQADLHYNGSDTVSVSVSDLGHTGSGGALLASDSVGVTVLAVNDAPQLTVPSGLSVDEDTELAVSGICVADIDSGAADLQVTLAVGHGQLTLGTTSGLTFTTGDGAADPALVFTGSLADINAALATLKYQADLHYNGSDTVSVSVSDLGHTGSGGALLASDSVGVTVLAVNDAPQLTVPSGLSVDEDTELAVSGICVADVDNGAADLRVTLAVGHGQLTLSTTSGLTFTTGDGTADPALVFTGSLADINAALATLKYQADLHYNGSDTVSVSVSDLGHTGSGGALLASDSVGVTVVAVNDAPTTIGLDDVKVDEDTDVTCVDLFAAFDDVEQSDNTLDYQIVDVANEALFQDVFIDGDNGWLVVRYAPNMHGTAEITVCVRDTEGLCVQDTLHVTTKSVNDAPVSSPDSYSVRGDEVLVVGPAGILSNDTDVDADKLTTQLLRGPRHGDLTLNANGSFVYKPDPSFVGIDTFTYAATDGDDRSQRTLVAIKVLVPSSPVDPNPETPGNEVPADNSIPAATPAAGTSTDPFNLQALSSAELPSTVAQREQATQAQAHEYQQHHDDQGRGADSSVAIVGQGSLSAGADDANGHRSLARARSSDDIIEAVATVVETSPAPVVSEAITPIVTVSQTELADLGTLLEDHSLFHRWMIGSAVGVTTGLTVGYVFWTVRAGYLLTGLIAQVPAWRFVDPLPILNSLTGDTGPVDAESLASIAEAGGGGASVTA